MNTIKTNQVLALVAIAVLAGGMVQYAAAKSPVLLAPLSGSGDDKGKAKFKVDDGVKKLEVEVQNLKPNTVYSVIAKGQSVGTITTNVFGNAGKTFLGLSVPSIVAGDNISIKLGTTLVLSGNFVA